MSKYKLLLIVLLFLIGLSCSSDPCEDLKDKAESCLDDVVKSLLLKVAKNGDKQECTDYLNSYYYSFNKRCVSENIDAGDLYDTE